jgi:hypothetical protein
VIVLSLALLAAAAVFLVVGILRGDSGTVLLVASIVSTVGAAVLLYLGVRPRSAGPAEGTTGTRSGPGDRAPAGAARAGGEPVAQATARSAGAVEDRRAGERVPASAPAAAEGAPSRTTATAARTPAGSPPVAVRAPAVPAGAPVDVPAAGSDEEDPPDEPGIEAAQLGDLARVAGRDDEVRVVDGRPRYHLAACAHLTGRESEGLPVSEASELGFTPCARCAPIATLLG